MLRACTFLTCVALLLTAAAGAQTLQSVEPRVADPGDTIRLLGTDLGSVSAVRFTATVGGFVGTWTITVPPASVASTEIVAVVPTFNSFAPGNATPPGELVGSIALLSGAVETAALPFGYLESTFGAVHTVGTGGSEPAGLAPRISFDPAGGAPSAGNQNFAAELFGSPPPWVALLAVGLPSQAPNLPLFGGELLINPLAPYVLLEGKLSVVPSVKLPIPPQVQGITVAMQWFTVSGFSPSHPVVAISDGLIATL
jgi:hypothetical protein